MACEVLFFFNKCKRKSFCCTPLLPKTLNCIFANYIYMQ